MSRLFARLSASVTTAVALSMSFMTVVPATADTSQRSAAVSDSTAPLCAHTILPSQKGSLAVRYVPLLTTLANQDGGHNRTRESASARDIKDVIDSNIGNGRDIPMFVMEQRVDQKDVSTNGDTTTVTYHRAMSFGRAKVYRYEYATVTNLRSEVTGTTVNVYGDYTERVKNGDIIIPVDSLTGIGTEPKNEVPDPNGEVTDSAQNVLLFTANLTQPIGGDVTTPGISEFKVSSEISQFGSFPAVMAEHLMGDGGQYPARIELTGEIKTQCDDPKDDPKDEPKENSGSFDSLLRGTGPSIFGIGSFSAFLTLLTSMSFLIPLFKNMLPSFMQGNLPK